MRDAGPSHAGLSRGREREFGGRKDPWDVCNGEAGGVEGCGREGNRHTGLVQDAATGPVGERPQLTCGGGKAMAGAKNRSPRNLGAAVDEKGCDVEDGGLLSAYCGCRCAHGGARDHTRRETSMEWGGHSTGVLGAGVTTD